MEKHKCKDCGVFEGELHKHGCLNEFCSKCYMQFALCNCFDYNDSYNRIPYLYVPIYCALCGKEWPSCTEDIFWDDDWKKYVPPLVYSNAQIHLLKTVICKKCYDRLKQIFPNGWRENN